MSDISRCPHCKKYIDSTFKLYKCPKYDASLKDVNLNAKIDQTLDFLEPGSSEFPHLPTPQGNWVAAIICTIITFYVMWPFKYIFVSPTHTLGGLIAICMVLALPIIASMLTVRYTRFRNIWGLVFVLSWI